MATNRQLVVVAVLAMTAVLAGCTSRPSTHPSASAGPASPSSAATKSTTTTSAPSIPIRSVDWGDVTVPGAVCDAPQAIKLNAGKATINTPPGVVAGTPNVIIEESRVTYGDLSGTGQDDAAVNVWCTNTGGTADGQIADSWVIFTAHVGSLRVIGTLVPQQPSNANLPHVAYFDDKCGGIEIQPGEITVHEVWYGPDDATCCPSIRATTVWTYTHGVLAPISTTRD